MSDLFNPTTSPKRRYRHGHKRQDGASPEYVVWRGMLTRCNKASNPNYPRYGARGIKVCERWQADFTNFLADMGRRPSLSMTLERLDNDGDYTPENCVWATKKAQANNRRSSRFITYLGVERTLAGWADAIGVRAGTLHYRFKSGWPVERALTTPTRRPF